MAIDKEDVTPEELPAIVEEGKWVEHLPAMVTNVILRAGEVGEGALNFQARVLDSRTRYLLEMLQGIVSGGIFLIGELPDEAALNAIPTEGLKIGTAYFVEFSLRVWNGTEWASSGSLRGKNGINLLGIWPDNLELPEITENEIGDAYIWRNDIHVLVPNNGTSKWEALGIRGPEGPGTYDTWKKQPGNEGKTEAEFLQAMKIKGDPGDDAYVAWTKIPANAGKTREQWAEETRGLKGENGKNLQILGTVANVAALDQKEKVDQAAWVTRNDEHLYVYVEADAEWKDLGRFNGKNGADGRNVYIKGALESTTDFPEDPADQDTYAVREDNSLYTYNSTINGWVNIGKFKGEDGKPGLSLIIKDAVDTFEDLPSDAADQDIYAVRETNTIYCYLDASGWVSLGEFKGEKGDTGLNSVAYWLSLPANEGKTEADYWAAMKGEAGGNLTINGTVADDAALQAIQNPKDQDAYVVNTTHRLWVWTTAGGGWKDLGPFKGADGKSAYQNWVDLGNVGTEEDFNISLKGKDGRSVYIKGSVATFADLPVNPVDQDVYSVKDENALYAYVVDAWLNLGAFKGKDGHSLDIIKILSPDDDVPPVASNANKGQAYIDLDKQVWVNIDNVWTNAGRFNGQPGDPGRPGTPLKLRGVVENLAALPPIGTGEGKAEEGDAWQTLDDKQTYVVVDGQWNGPFDFVGPVGGEGEKGDPGATVAIKDTYPDMAALRAAHPTGTQTDAYMLEDGHLVIWAPSINDWKDVGQFSGPPGKEGPPGEGLPGKPGDKGDVGSRWLTLPKGEDTPSESFSGRVGDWAVSYSSLRVFYKTANNGWEFWGFLVAGDVNSPPSAMGRVARLGEEWVPLPIDAVPSPVAGKYYVQMLKADSGDKTEWKELVLPETIADLTAKDDKQYVRVFPSTGASKPIWKELNVVFNRYDLAIKEANATIQIDPAIDQVVNLDNQVNTAKIISIKNHLAARAMPLVVRIKGNTGSISWGGTNIKWDSRLNAGSPPDIMAGKTVLIFLWDGEVWIGSLSSNVA